MSCRYNDPDTGATHEEIIDSLSEEVARAIALRDLTRKENATLRRRLKDIADVSQCEEINVPLRMYIALRMLRAWNSGTAGFDGDVVVTVNKWIDDGMKGRIPFPKSPFFADWAEKHGFSNIDGNIGFLLKGELLDFEIRNSQGI